MLTREILDSTSRLGSHRDAGHSDPDGQDCQGSPVALTSLQFISASMKRSYKSISTSAGSFLFPATEPATDSRLQVRPYERYKAYIEEGLEITAEGLELPVELEPQRTSGCRMDGGYAGNPIPQFRLWLRNTPVTVPP